MVTKETVLSCSHRNRIKHDSDTLTEFSNGFVCSRQDPKVAGAFEVLEGAQICYF